MTGSQMPLVVGALTPAGEAAPAILSAKAAPLFELEAAARGGEDMDAVHDMRVASRRSREALRLFAPLYPGRVAREWDAVFGRVTRSLGLVRDDDVYIDAMHRLAARAKDAEERATLAYLIGYRQGRRADDLRRMRKHLGTLDLARKRARFESELAHPRSVADAARPLATMAGEALETRLAAVFGHLPDALRPENAETQHAMRIDCKRLRYAVETFEPCFGEGYGELRALLVAFQDELGELHDLDVFLAHVRALRADAGARAACVSASGIARLVADLEARRDRRFRRVRRLLSANPESAVRARISAALTTPSSR